MKKVSRKELGYLLLIVVLVLVGYHPLFSGANFFTQEDSVTMFDYQHGNAVGNGWRPDKGLGISFFFGGPGMYHAWSMYSLLEKVFDAPLMVFNISIIILLILAGIALYLVLSRINSEDKITNALLSLLIIFGPLQQKFLFQRHWIPLVIGTPLILHLLKSFFEKRQFTHYLYMGLLFWFAVIFGSACSFLQVGFVGFLFMILYYLYYRPSIKTYLKDCVVINVAGVCIMLALGAWIFYSFFLELRVMSYVREHVQSIDMTMLNVKQIPFFFLRFLHCGLYPVDASLPFALDNMRISFINPTVISPLLFVFIMFFKPKNFWHYFVKWATIILLVNEFLDIHSPLYASMARLLLAGSYHFGKFQPVYHCFMIMMIGIFLENLDDFFKLNKKVLVGIRCLAGLLVSMYVSLAILMIVIELKPGLLVNGLNLAGNLMKFSEGRKVFLQHVVQFFSMQLRNAIRWHTIFFYLLSAFLAYLFIDLALLKRILRRKIVFVVLLVINGFFLSWSFYPLNHEKLVWQYPYAGGKTQQEHFQPTDRFYSFLAYQKKSQNIEDFKDKWKTDEKGIVKKEHGFRKFALLNLSGLKSYTQKDVAEFINYIFSHESKNVTYIASVKKIPLNEMRDLALGPVIASPLIDMLAVKYYYSSRAYPNMLNTLELLPHEDVVVYRNKNAWPYYYLANRIKSLNEEEFLTRPKKGTAYLKDNDIFELRRKKATSSIDLNKFSYGEMKFSYDSDRDNLLVIADAWHPFWKAQKDNGESLSVIKANKVFKGIKLPPGRYDIKVYFDNSPYKPGIFIAIISWVLFLGVWVGKKMFGQKGVAQR